MYKELRNTQSCVGMQGATLALLLNDADGHASGHAVVATHACTRISLIFEFFTLNTNDLSHEKTL